MWDGMECKKKLIHSFYCGSLTRPDRGKVRLEKLLISFIDLHYLRKQTKVAMLLVEIRGDVFTQGLEWGGADCNINHKQVCLSVFVLHWSWKSFKILGEGGNWDTIGRQEEKKELPDQFLATNPITRTPTNQEINFCYFFQALKFSLVINQPSQKSHK